MERRKIFRFIAYVLLAVLTVFVLILYLVYLSAQKLPEFYREALDIPNETQQLRNKEVIRTARNLNNDIQTDNKPWQGTFTDADLNAYFAVEVAKPGANFFPKEIREPRILFSSRAVDFACRIEEGAFTGILHVEFGLTLPEPNQLAIRIKETRIGTLPISRDRAVSIIQEALKKHGIESRLGNEGGDPVISFPFELKIGKKQLFLEELNIQNGSVHFFGTSEKKNKEN